MQRLIAGAQELRISLRTEHLDALHTYQRQLIEWNQRFNLTAITDETGIQIRHFLDSLSCLLALESGENFAGKRIIDVGTGAGFPGIPLKIVCPGMKLTLLEATAKKTHFLQHIVGELMKGFLRPRPVRDDAIEVSLSGHLQGALAAISLAGHPSLATAFANDVTADMVFAQQVYGLGRRGDVFLGNAAIRWFFLCPDGNHYRSTNSKVEGCLLCNGYTGPYPSGYIISISVSNH